MPDLLILDELRSLILKKNEIREISPSDCRAISHAIQKELHKNISETTLKRLFGFAAIKHPFSRFTINTLKEYVADQYKMQNHFSIQQSALENIDYIKQTALNITQFTLRNIRNRSAVPFEMTVGRKFANYDFEFFYNSEHSFTAFIAQPGCGKSILMYHLAQDLFLAADAKYRNDLLLFINVNFVFNLEQEQIDLEEALKVKLGITAQTDLISYFKDYYEKSGNKLVVFFDGFSELVVNKHFKSKIFDSLISFICAIEDHSHVKVLFGMRSTTWSRFFERIRHAHFLKKKWFPGSYYNPSYNANVPPLNEKELKAILEKMGPLDFKQMSSNLKSELKFPFHIQWYYKLREEYPIFNSYTNIIFFEIIAKFIQEKIYQSTYATEKIVFCKKIIQFSNNGKRDHSILKTDLIKEMATFNNAYMQLLADGILMEEKQYLNGAPIEFVRFIQPHVFEYFLFIELLDVFNQRMGRQFFQFIQNEYFDNQNRFQLLQWSIRTIVYQKQFEHVADLLMLPLTNYEKNYLIYFIAENINYQANHDPEILTAVKTQQLHKILIDQFIHFDFIDSCYKEAVTSLLNVVDTNENALIYQVILAMFDCLNLNIGAISMRLVEMRKLNEEGKKWCINPYEILHLIELNMKGLSVKGNEILNKIEAFKSGENSLNLTENELPTTKDIICFILILIVNLFYGSPKATIEIINSILKFYPKLLQTRSSFSIYLLTLIAQAYGRSNQWQQAERIEKALNNLYQGYSKNKFTLYTQTILFSFLAEQSKNRSDYPQAIQYAEDCIIIYKRNDLAINRIFMYNLLIDIYGKINNEEKMNDYIFKKLSLIDNKKVNPSPFHKNNYN